MRNYEIKIASLNIIKMDLDRSVQFFDPEDYNVRKEFSLSLRPDLTCIGTACDFAEHSLGP